MSARKAEKAIRGVRAAVAAERPDLAGGGDAVHHRHLDVEQDQIVSMLAREDERLLAMLDRIDIAAHAPQEGGGQQARRIRILGEEDARPRPVGAFKLSMHYRRRIPVPVLRWLTMMTGKSCVNLCAEPKSVAGWLNGAAN